MSARRGRLRGLNAAVIASAAVAVAAAIAALIELREISNPRLIDIAISRASLAIEGDSVRGVIAHGLPRFELHWDGQPASAILIDSNNATLAAAALSDRTFDTNRNAVRFVDGEVRFKLDRRRLPSDRLVALRCEVVKSRIPFEIWAAVAIVFTVLALALIGARRVAVASDRDRDAVWRGLIEDALFLGMAAMVFTTVYPGAPVRVDEMSDQANINAFAAALDHPERVSLDRFLATRSHFDWYIPTYVTAVRLAKHAGFHYRTAEAFIGAAAALLLLFGLRRLFVTISGSRNFALAGALTLALLFDQSMLPAPGELWSIVDVLPRTAFAAFVPWVMLLAIHATASARRWWIPCAATGLLLFVYPLGVPLLAACVIVGLFVSSDEPVARRLAGLAMAGLAILITTAPYVVAYVGRYGQNMDADPDLARHTSELVRLAFADLNVGLAIRTFVEHRLVTFRAVVDVVALVLLVRARWDACSRFYAGVFAAFCIVTFAAPAVDGAISAHFGRRPLEYDLIRGVRYFDLLVAGALAVGVRHWGADRRRTTIRAAVVTACVVLAFGPAGAQTMRMLAGRTRLSWRILQGRPDYESGAAQEAIRAVTALRAPDQRVAGPTGLRQYGVPLAWLPRDVLSLAYSPSSELLQANDAVNEAAPYFAAPLTPAAVSHLATILDVQLFLFRRRDLDQALERSDRLLFENDVYAIVAAPTPSADARDGRVSRSTAREIVGASSIKA